MGFPRRLMLGLGAMIAGLCLTYVLYEHFHGRSCAHPLFPYLLLLVAAYFLLENFLAGVARREEGRGEKQ